MLDSAAAGVGPVPRVSVALCTFNRSAFLAEAAAGVLAQTESDLELVICDDASTDDTAAVCDRLAASDPRVRVVRHRSNIGMAANWAAAVGHCRGAYVAKLDDDNRYLPTFLAELLVAFDADPAAGVAFCDEWMIGPAGDRRPGESADASRRFGRAGLAAGPQPDVARLAVELSISVNGSLVRRSALDAVGGFRPWADVDGDTLLFLHLAAAGVRATYVPRRLSEYRMHGGQSTADTVPDRARSAASVRVWQSVRFTGPAERVRRTRLAHAISGHVRTLLILGGAADARAWALRGVAMRPLSARSWAVAIVAHLPARSVQRRLGARQATRG